MHLSDSVVQFIFKARLQLLMCNSLLHVYYPNVSRHCSRCGFFTETVSHILNGCPHNKSAIQNRHNRIANIVSKAVSAEFPQSTILCDKIVKPTHFQQSNDQFEAVPHTRPDMCIISNEQRECFIVEVTVPFDVFMDDSYQAKFDKYLPLCQRISDIGFNCRIIVLIVGSTGSVHKKFVSGLCMAGLTPARARAIAKYCSISAAIGSKIIWKQRCKHT